MSTAMTWRAILQWFSIRDAILTETRQGIEFSKDTDHRPVTISVAGDKSGRNISHTLFECEACLLEGIYQCFGRFKLFVSQFSISPDFVAQLDEHRPVGFDPL